MPCRGVAAFSLMVAQAYGISSAELKEQLLVGYDRDKWPGWTPTSQTPTEIGVQYYVNSLWGIDQKKQEFTAEVYFRAYWRDPRLAYNASLMGEVQFDNDAGRLWLPDFYWPNSRGMHHDESLLEVYPSGNIWWSQRKRITFTCLMFFHKLPYDTQRCFMTVSTYADKASQAQLDWKFPDVIADGLHLVNNNEWNIGDTAAGTKKVAEYAGGVKYDELYAEITFERRTNMQPIYFSLMFVVISYCGFWINPAAAPGRIALAVICVLIVLTSIVNEFRGYPNISYTVWLREFMTGCLIFNLIAVFEYPIVNFGMTQRAKIADQRKKKQVEPQEGVDLDDIRVSQQFSERASQKIARWKEPFFNQCYNLDYYFRGLFPLAFLIFFIAMWLYEPGHPNES